MTPCLILATTAPKSERRVSRDLKVRGRESMEDIGIDVLNYESICVDHSYSTGNPVKVDMACKIVKMSTCIINYSLGTFRISHSKERRRRRPRKLTVMEVLYLLQCRVAYQLRMYSSQDKYGNYSLPSTALTVQE